MGRLQVGVIENHRLVCQKGGWECVEKNKYKKVQSSSQREKLKKKISVYSVFASINIR